MTTQEVIVLANHACDMIVSHRYEEAISELKVALVKNKAALANCYRKKRSKEELEVATPNYILQECMTMPVDSSSSCCKNDEETSFAGGLSFATSTGFVYNQPIRAPQKTTSPVTYHDITVTLSSILCFNLALAFHGFGMQQSQNLAERREILEKAASLYTLAQKITLAEESTHSDISFFLLAIVNNIGQIHRDLGQFGQADMYFDKALTLLMYWNDCNDWRVEDSALVQGFIGNTTHLVLKTSVTAKAA